MCAAPKLVGLSRVIEDAQDAFDDVVDVGEVATHLSVVEDVNGFAFEDGLGEEEEGHVRPSPGAVDGEKPEAGGGEVEEFAVAVRHEFVALLGGGVEAHRVVHAVVRAEGHGLVEAVDG